MYSLALDLIQIKGHKPDDFEIGFHAQPSMRHLHMHVISTDFDSPTLKTQRHWNSFHTELFIPHQGKVARNPMWFDAILFCILFENLELIARIKEEGEIMPLDQHIVDELRRTPLKCHRCNVKQCTLSALKWHLKHRHLAWIKSSLATELASIYFFIAWKIYFQFECFHFFNKAIISVIFWQLLKTFLLTAKRR